MASSNRLNLSYLREEFSASVIQSDNEEKDISVSHYVNAYTVLLEIVKSFGRVFYFVVKDAQDKINILSVFLSKEPDNYRTLETMAHFERDNGRLTPKFPANGSRTYLRLHRALLFILRLIEEIVEASSKEESEETKERSLGEITDRVYKETLAEHHEWLVRKAVSLAVYALPTRRNFLANLCREAGVENQDTLIKLLRESIPVLEDTYNVSQHLYATNDLLSLP